MSNQQKRMVIYHDGWCWVWKYLTFDEVEYAYEMFKNHYDSFEEYMGTMTDKYEAIYG